MAKPSWMHSHMHIIHFVEVSAPRMAKACATTRPKALVEVQGDVSFSYSIQAVQLLPSKGGLLRDGALMHPKYMHELCNLLMHIPTYYNVISCYNHVL
jgi:hypothetical protein